MAELIVSISENTVESGASLNQNDLLLFALHDPYPAFRFNADGMITSSNDSGRSLIKPGNTDIDAAGLFPPLQGLNFGKCIKEGSSFRFPFRINDSAFEVNVKGIPASGCGLIYCSEITALKKTEEELKSTIKKLKQLSNHSHVAEEIEKQKLSKELHDNTGQILTGIKLRLELLKGKRADTSAELAEIISLLETAMKQVRGLSYRLKPRILDDLGLIPSLNLLCTETTNNTGIRNIFQAHNLNSRIGLSIEIGLYRIAQEAISNITLHSGASEFTVQLFQEDKQLRMMIEDDGKGFDVNLVKAYKKKMGILNMEERALSLGGICHIDSQQESGTTITVEIPLETIE